MRRKALPIPMRTPDPDGYCPYCNKISQQPLSEEHIIPRSIGGTDETVIYICKPCNDNAGFRVDTSLTKHSVFSMRSVFKRIVPRQYRIPGKVHLHDGRTLEGAIFTEAVEGGFQFRFNPNKQQPNGELWLHEKSLKDLKATPANHHIYTDSMVHQFSMPVLNPETMDLGPAIAKILCGFAYMTYGRELVSLPQFDVLRKVIKTGSMGGTSLFWAYREQLNNPHTIGAPLPKPNEDVIWLNMEPWGYIQGGIMFGGTTFAALLTWDARGCDLEFARFCIPVGDDIIYSEYSRNKQNVEE